LLNSYNIKKFNIGRAFADNGRRKNMPENAKQRKVSLTVDQKKLFNMVFKGHLLKDFS
jgi:hypothetical protein